MSISENLKALQEQAGMTTAELAEKANLPVDTINKIRTGATRSPSMDTLQRLASALGVTLDVLVGNSLPDTAKPASATISADALLAFYGDTIQHLRDDRDWWRKMAIRLITAVIVLLIGVAGLLALFYWDMSHPTMGNIIYSGISAAH